MDVRIEKYIDSIILDNYTTNIQEFESQELSRQKLKSIMQYLFYYDETFKEKVEEYVHLLIEERKQEFLREDREDKGLIRVVDRVNGEVTWRKSA